MPEISIKIILLLSFGIIIIISIFTYFSYSQGFHKGYTVGRLDEKEDQRRELRRIAAERRLENISVTNSVQERPVFIDGRKKYGLR